MSQDFIGALKCALTLRVSIAKLIYAQYRDKGPWHWHGYKTAHTEYTVTCDSDMRVQYSGTARSIL